MVDEEAEVLVGTDDVPLELATEVTDDEALVLVLVPARLLTTLSRGCRQKE